MRGLYSGVVLLGIGMGMVVGQGVAVASPAESSEQSGSSGASQTGDTNGTTSGPVSGTTVEPDRDDAEADDATTGDEADLDADLDAADGESADDGALDGALDGGADAGGADAEGADAEEATDEAADREPAPRSSARSQQRAEAESPAPGALSAEALSADVMQDVTAASPQQGAVTEAPPVSAAATTGTRTLRTLADTRPVTVQSMVTDVLTWVGLRPIGSDNPAPGTPVSALVQSLWLAVRQFQYTWNNQRPTAAVTISGPGPDGTVGGNLNAVDYDDVALTYTLVAGPTRGRVVMGAAGGFVYTPGAAAAGRSDTFTVRIDDTGGNPFHVHGLLGLLGITRPTEVTVVIAANPAGPHSVLAAFDIDELTARGGVAVLPGRDRAVGVIDGRFTDQLVVNVEDAAVVLNSLASALGAAADFAEPSAITISTVGRGATAEYFYRYTEKVGAVTVLGSEVILVTDAAGTVTSVFNYYQGLGADFDVTPDESVDEHDEVRLVALSAYLGPDADTRTLQQWLAVSTFAHELVVHPREDDDTPTLVWRVTVVVPDTGALTPSGASYLIYADGATAGTVMASTSHVHSATSTSTATDWLGQSRVVTIDTRKVLWYRSYQLLDAGRNITTYKTTYGLFGLGSPKLPGSVVKRGLFGWDAAAVSAHANMAVAYDYFLDVLGRQSFDDDGALVVVSIRYNPRTSAGGYANAFWDPSRQLFGFGDSGYLQAGLDIVAHEFSHAVVSYVVGNGGSVLDYAESGALNEAYADIFGLLVEGKTGADRWLIGEDSALGAVRNLADPTSIRTAYGPHRDRYSTRYTGTGDDGGEHVNSTIFSHAAYLMMTNSATAGVSDQAWAKVFYHSLGRLSRTARFVDGRAAVLSTARAQGFTDAQLAAIASAFDTVEIYGAAASSAIAA